MPQATKALTAGQFLLTTLIVKVAIVAVLSTMLVRFPWFRRILLTKKRDWPERLIFAASLGVPLTAGVIARLLIHYDAADLTLSGAFLAGLLADPTRAPSLARLSGFHRWSRENGLRFRSQSGVDLRGAGCARFVRRRRS